MKLSYTLLLSILGTLLCPNISQAGGAKPIFSDLPEPYTVYAVGAYDGTKPLGFAIDQSGESAMLNQVVVNLPNRNIVLALTAYKPSVWYIGRTSGTKIVGILVSGHDRQAISGLNKEIPVKISTFAQPGEFPPFFAYKAEPSLLEMNSIIQQLTGQEIHRLIIDQRNPNEQPLETWRHTGWSNQSYDRIYYIGERPREANRVLYDEPLNSQTFRVAAEPAALSGRRALDALVAAGKLRPARQDDIDAWVTAASEKYRRFNPELRVDDHYMERNNTFVVLDSIELPDGLYGADSVNLIITKGVETPRGQTGHNTFYFSDGTLRSVGDEQTNQDIHDRAALKPKL